MKIVLLGADGMLGHALQEVFAEEELTAWDKRDLDITDREAVVTKIDALRQAQGGIDVIVNAAAFTDVDGAQEQRELAFAVNGEAVGYIVEAAQEAGAHLVQYSTDYVFSGDEQSGYTEDASPGPAVNVYGESKLAGEEKLRASGVSFFLIRTAWLYGPYGENFVRTMLRLADERDELRVIDDQHGSPTYTVDLAAATQAVLAGEYAPGTYHLVNEEVATWYQLAKKACEVAGRKVDIVPIATEEYPVPAARPQYSILRNTKGPRLRPWEEAVTDYVQNIAVTDAT